MHHFFIIAAAHFLALLSPGPDFFLIARTSLSSGWRVASGACVGIAVANGLFILAAFAGMAALRPDSTLFAILQLAGSLYLMRLGILFIRHAGTAPLERPLRQTSGSYRSALVDGAWRRAAGAGFLSGILNPKNALFYASLAAMLTGSHASAAWKTVYGAWMFGIVLLWDLLVAILIGNPMVLRRFARVSAWLERLSGIMLIAIALGVIGALWGR